MKKTEKLKLNMPEMHDSVNIEDLNFNALVLDKTVSDLKDLSATKEEVKAVDNKTINLDQTIADFKETAATKEEVKALKDNVVNIKDFAQKLDKTDNVRAPLFLMQVQQLRS